MAYNIAPTPMYGTGGSAYGAAPGTIDIPPSEYEQVQSIYPDLGLQAQLAGRNIGAGLAGELSPQTIFQLQQNAARFGQSSGMPGSGLQTNMGLLSMGQNVEQAQANALNQYQGLAKTLGSMQTPQALASEIASRNATMLAAPSPELAAKQQMADWMSKFNMTAAKGKSGGGMTINPSGGTSPSQMGFGRQNFSNLGASGGDVPTEGYVPWNWSQSDYSPGGSTVFGTTVGGDVFDPFAGTAGQSPAYGTLPGYNPADYATDPMASLIPNSGYQPTSAGTMYMGSESGYNG